LSKIHFSSKSTFSNLDFNKVILSKTARTDLIEEDLEFNDYELTAIKNIFEFIFEDFESSPDKKELWETIYTFPYENNEKIIKNNFLDNRKQIEIINSSISDCELFLNAILNRAISSKNNTFNEVANSIKSKFFVVGDIGVGKTTFFKYLQAKYFDKIVASHCFYLHIDFSIEFYQKLTISESIKHEAARMFRLYYFDKLTEQQKKEFKNFIGDYYAKDPDKLIKDYKNFSTKPDPQDFKPYSFLFQKALINYIERNYGVVYILDGLDKLNSLEEFQTKYEEVNTILSTPRRKGVFLFVMRFDSHESFHKSYLDNLNSAEKARPFGKVFKIEEAKLNNIIDKRLNLLIQKWETIIDERKTDIFNNLPAEKKDLITQKANELRSRFSSIITKNAIVSYFYIFLVYLQRGIALDEDLIFREWDNTTPISKLKNLIGNNFRNLMDAINVIHEAFLSDIFYLELKIDDIMEIHAQLNELKDEFLIKDSSLSEKFRKLINRSYKVIPLLLKERDNYLHPYYYHFSSVNNELTCYGNYDHSKFLYNIFYPINSIDSIEQQYTILLKIRIIQLLKLYEKEHYIINTKEQLSLAFKIYFNYEPQYVDLAIEELFETRLIRLDIKEYGYTVIASRTGLNHIENLIYNFGYYRIILSDTLIPKGYEKAFIDPNPDLYESNRPLWVLSQIPRISLFLLLLKRVESFEEKHRSSHDLKFENITESISKSVINSITKICGAHDKDLENLNSAFRNLKSILPTS
jgi:hypothetical protein